MCKIPIILAYAIAEQESKRIQVSQVLQGLTITHFKYYKYTKSLFAQLKFQENRLCQLMVRNVGFMSRLA